MIFFKSILGAVSIIIMNTCIDDLNEVFAAEPRPVLIESYWAHIQKEHHIVTPQKSTRTQRQVTRIAHRPYAIGASEKIENVEKRPTIIRRRKPTKSIANNLNETTHGSFQNISGTNIVISNNSGNLNEDNHQSASKLYKVRNNGDGERQQNKIKQKHMKVSIKRSMRSNKRNDGEDNNESNESTDNEQIATKEHENRKSADSGTDGKFAKGGGKKHFAEHKNSQGEKNEEEYDGHHTNEKSEKGHHDKENHEQHYEEDGGLKKEHNHDDGYQDEGAKGKKGEKFAKFEEKGDHQKGYSTKGEHHIDKKDEYEKNQEFYDESHDEGASEKHGGFHFLDEFKKGFIENAKNKNGAEKESFYGKNSEGENGEVFKDAKGHKDDEGHNDFHKSYSESGQKSSKNNGKKWAFKKGSSGKQDGKTAPLIEDSSNVESKKMQNLKNAKSYLTRNADKENSKIHRSSQESSTTNKNYYIDPNEQYFDVKNNSFMDSKLFTDELNGFNGSGEDEEGNMESFLSKNH